MAGESDDDELLRGLTGQARRERAELIHWLLAHDFDVQQIQDALVPMLLPAHRVVGDDGTYVSAQQICDATGIAPELLRRLHQAVGLPRVDDPTAAVPISCVRRENRIAGDDRKRSVFSRIVSWPTGS